MWQMSAFRILRTNKKLLSLIGLTNCKAVQRLTLCVKQNWFGQFYGGSSKSVLVSVKGAKFSLPTRYIQHYIFQEYEPITTKAILSTLRPGMVFVDIGAHIGYYSLIASKKVGATGKVHSIEPSQENLSFLRENIRLNQSRNVHVHAFAAGTAHRSRLFHVTGASDSHGFYAHPYATTVQLVKVEERPLDEIVKEPINAAKIDAEGAEIEVLEGMRSQFAMKSLSSLWVEWNPACMRNAGYDPLDLPDYLSKLGFERIQVLDDLNKRIISLEEALATVRGGTEPHFWYVNLWATRD